MATYLEISKDKRILILDTNPCLYSMSDELEKAKPLYPIGKNLYFHKSRNENEYFYFHIWSMEKGFKRTNQLCSWTEAQSFLQEKLCYDDCSKSEDRQAESLEKDYGFDLMEETG